MYTKLVGLFFFVDFPFPVPFSLFVIFIEKLKRRRRKIMQEGGHERGRGEEEKEGRQRGKNNFVVVEVEGWINQVSMIKEKKKHQTKPNPWMINN